MGCVLSLLRCKTTIIISDAKKAKPPDEEHIETYKKTDESISKLAPEDKDSSESAYETYSDGFSSFSGHHLEYETYSDDFSSFSGHHLECEISKKTIVRNFGILENDLDPLHFMDDLFERGCITPDRMDEYKSINTRNKRARRFLLDFISDPKDYTQTLIDVLKEKKHSFVLGELIRAKNPCNRMTGCRHPTCCLTIIKNIIINSQRDMVPVDSGKIIIPLLEEFLLPPFHYFEDIASEETMRKRNEKFIKYVENVKCDKIDLISVFLHAVKEAGYDIFKLFMQHCYKHDGFPSDCQEKWKETIWKQQEMQGNTMKDLQLRNGLQDNIDVDDTLYQPTGNENIIMKIIPQNISEKESKTIVHKINREKKEINTSLSPQRIIEARQGCIQIKLAVSEEKDIDATMKSINHLLEWGDLFYKIKDKHVIIKLYSIHIPSDAEEENENETLSKYRIVRNFPFLIEEIDVLLFVKPFTEKNILSEEDFENKFMIGRCSRKLRTSYFLNYILKADIYTLKTFYEVLQSPKYKYIFDKLVENEADGFPLGCQKEQICKQQEMQGPQFRKSDKYMEPKDQTLPWKTSRSNSTDSSFYDDENCHPPTFYRKKQKEGSSTRQSGVKNDISVDLGYGSLTSRTISTSDGKHDDTLTTIGS